jgi:hypothetical protein
MLPRAPSAYSANCDRVGRCRPPIWRVFDLPLPIDPRTMVNHLRLRRRCRAGGGSSPVGKGARAARALVERAAASPSGERLGLLPTRCAASPALAVRGGARGRRLRLTTQLGRSRGELGTTEDTGRSLNVRRSAGRGYVQPAPGRPNRHPLAAASKFKFHARA